MKLSRNGAYLVTVDSAEQGFYSRDGSTRVSTEDGQGIYDSTGALRVVFDEAGTGVYSRSGKIRVSEGGTTGVYNRDGSWNVEVV